MEPTQRRKNDAHAQFRRHALLMVGLAALLGCGFSRSASAAGPIYPRHTREHFRHNMPATIRADHPAIVPLAAAIRAVTTDPLQELAVVNDVTHLLVDYDDDERVYGTPEFHATLDEMLARRRQGGWVYLRDDCDGRAVFAAHLLASLGIPWRLEASYWKEHAWVVATVNHVDYDLLDLREGAPETERISYKLWGHLFVRPTRRPPAFAWRRAWAQHTGRDLLIGKELGMLTLDSTPSHLRERYATDWTVRVPNGKLSPVDDRYVGVAMAGFPFGEPLNVAAIASHTVPSKKTARTPALAGVTTSASTSPDGQPALRKAGAE